MNDHCCTFRLVAVESIGRSLERRQPSRSLPLPTRYILSLEESLTYDALPPRKTLTNQGGLRRKTGGHWPTPGHIHAKGNVEHPPDYLHYCTRVCHNCAEMLYLRQKVSDDIDDSLWIETEVALTPRFSHFRVTALQSNSPHQTKWPMSATYSIGCCQSPVVGGKPYLTTYQKLLGG